MSSKFAVDGWFKSSRSGGSDNCVQAKHLPDGSTVVRHSQQPGGVELVFSAARWRALLKTVQTTSLPTDSDGWSVARPHGNACARARHTADGAVQFTHTATADEGLTFTAGEWSAFVEGVRAGEFAWRRPIAQPEPAPR